MGRWARKYFTIDLESMTFYYTKWPGSKTTHSWGFDQIGDVMVDPTFSATSQNVVSLALKGKVLNLKFENKPDLAKFLEILKNVRNSRCGDETPLYEPKAWEIEANKKELLESQILQHSRSDLQKKPSLGKITTNPQKKKKRGDLSFDTDEEK